MASSMGRWRWARWNTARNDLRARNHLSFRGLGRHLDGEPAAHLRVEFDRHFSGRNSVNVGWLLHAFMQGSDLHFHQFWCQLDCDTCGVLSWTDGGLLSRWKPCRGIGRVTDANLEGLGGNLEFNLSIARSRQPGRLFGGWDETGCRRRPEFGRRRDLYFGRWWH
jgi:hypothetical protein